MMAVLGALFRDVFPFDDEREATRRRARRGARRCAIGGGIVAGLFVLAARPPRGPSRRSAVTHGRGPMRFSVKHKFPGTLARLEALLVDPGLYARLERALPALARIELLSNEEVGGVVRRRVRYTPRVATERVPAYGRGRITPEMLIWVEESAFDRAAHRIDYRVEPNLPERWRDRFESRGVFTFHEEADGVVRRIEGEVTVRVPVLGLLAERHLVKEACAGFDADARVLASWLA
jgi:hypothetical protein